MGPMTREAVERGVCAPIHATGFDQLIRNADGDIVGWVHSVFTRTGKIGMTSQAQLGRVVFHTQEHSIADGLSGAGASMGGMTRATGNLSIRQRQVGWHAHTGRYLDTGSVAVLEPHRATRVDHRRVMTRKTRFAATDGGMSGRVLRRLDQAGG